jgi:hypothetical protein
MVATGNFSDAWLYLTAPIVGAIVAAPANPRRNPVHGKFE